MYSPFSTAGEVSSWLAGPSGLEMEAEFHLEPLMRAIAQAHRSEGLSQTDVALVRTTLEVLRVIWPGMPPEGHEVLIDQVMAEFRQQMSAAPADAMAQQQALSVVV